MPATNIECRYLTIYEEVYTRHVVRINDSQTRCIPETNVTHPAEASVLWVARPVSHYAHSHTSLTLEISTPG